MSAPSMRSIAYLPSRIAPCRDALPPVFLAPSITCPPHARPFHASHLLSSGTRKARNNPNRGVSPLRRKGIRKSLDTFRVGEAVQRDGLPKPVSEEQLPELKVNTKHGLWQFFNDKKLLTFPIEDLKHGRAWTLAECRLKSFQQLHQLWYACVKERNRLATEVETKNRLLEDENQMSKLAIAGRDKTIRKTMKAVKWALTERWYAWEDAWEMAQTDPKIDLSNQPAYLPRREELNQKDQPKPPEDFQMA